MNTAPPLPPQRILAGQKALVTGANSGIGRGVAIALGEAGADVIVNYVAGDEAAEAVVNEHPRRRLRCARRQGRRLLRERGRGHVRRDDEALRHHRHSGQ